MTEKDNKYSSEKIEKMLEEAELKREEERKQEIKEYIAKTLEKTQKIREQRNEPKKPRIIEKPKMIVKKIEVEVEFPDDFTPPEKFIEPSRENRWGWDDQCWRCPFYINNDEYPQFDECFIGGYEECPLKKYFN